MEVFHAYFSKQQCEKCGSCFYFDMNGKEIEVTQVTNTGPKEIKKGFSDLTYIGFVAKWSRSGSKANSLYSQEWLGVYV